MTCRWMSWSAGSGRGHRTAAAGDSAPAGGWSSGDAPPIFFSVLAEKKTGRARSKRKDRFDALRCSGPPRDGGRRIGACSDLALPSGTLFSSARSILPSRGGWCGGGRGAKPHLTSFSFRAFRFATRCPGGCRGRCPHRPAAEAFINHRPAAAKREAGCIPDFPGLKVSPKGRAFPSLTAARDRQPSPAGGRRSAPAQTDPPNIFSFPPGAAHFLLDVSKWGPRRAPRGGERRSKGAGAVFAAGGNGA